jgi:hypothetical protein
MGLITNEAEFISYVRRMLGNPVINVEVADVNISDCIYDSIQQFQRYNIGEGSVRDVLAISLSANVSAYDLSGMDIDAVLDIQLTNQIYNINTLFSPTHMLLYNQFQNGAMTGAAVNGGVANLGGSGVLGNYMIQMMYLSEIQEMFQRKYVCDFDTGSQRLKIRPTPNQDDVGVLMVFKKESAINLYNHVLVKRLALAKARQLHAWALIKYNLSLPGSGNIGGGNDLMSRSIQDEKDALEDIRLEGDSPIMMVG